MGNDGIEDDMNINEHCKRPPIIKETKKITDEQENWFENCFLVLILFHVAHSKIYMFFIVFQFFLTNNGNLFMPLWSKKINYE